MINQREIFVVPEFVLPRTSTRSLRAVDYRLKDSPVVENIREKIPVFYKKLAVCLTAIILGTGVGIVTPLVTQAMERWQYF